jgi:hypothetical protein
VTVRKAVVQHQVCKAHVLRNTEDLIEKYQPLVDCDADGKADFLFALHNQPTSPRRATCPARWTSRRSGCCEILHGWTSYTDAFGVFPHTVR